MKSEERKDALIERLRTMGFPVDSFFVLVDAALDELEEWRGGKRTHTSVVHSSRSVGKTAAMKLDVCAAIDRVESVYVAAPDPAPWRPEVGQWVQSKHAYGPRAELVARVTKVYGTMFQATDLEGDERNWHAAWCEPWVPRSGEWVERPTPSGVCVGIYRYVGAARRFPYEIRDPNGQLLTSWATLDEFRPTTPPDESTDDTCEECHTYKRGEQDRAIKATSTAGLRYNAMIVNEWVQAARTGSLRHIPDSGAPVPSTCQHEAMELAFSRCCRHCGIDMGEPRR